MSQCQYCSEPLPEAAVTCPACAEPATATTFSAAEEQINAGAPQLSPKRKIGRFWSVCCITLSILALIGAALELHNQRYWPFATGSDSPAFIGTTFGMSPQEVGRVLAGHGSCLLPYDQFKRLESLHQTSVFDFVYISNEEQLMYSDLFMPSITMFDTQVEAKFTFRHLHLASVSVYFGCYSISQAENLVESVKSKLLTAYVFQQRLDSPYIPGAFDLNYSSASSTASLWVNLTDTNKLIVNLTLIDSRGEAERKKQLQRRENEAFRQ